jgi:hypothetical protein
MTTVAYVLGLPNALLLGLIAGIAEIIPIVGPLLGAIPALLVAATTGQVELVLLVAGVYLVIQVVEGNILVPMVMKSTIGVPPFLIVVSLVVSRGVWSAPLLAVPLRRRSSHPRARRTARRWSPSRSGWSIPPSEEEREAMGRVSSSQRQGEVDETLRAPSPSDQASAP